MRTALPHAMAVFVGAAKLVRLVAYLQAIQERRGKAAQ
jgi:hypothetical protein